MKVVRMTEAGLPGNLLIGRWTKDLFNVSVSLVRHDIGTSAVYWSAYRFAAARSLRSSSAVRRGP